MDHRLDPGQVLVGIGLGGNGKVLGPHMLNGSLNKGNISAL